MAPRGIFLLVQLGYMPFLKIGHRTGRCPCYRIIVRKPLIFEVSICYVLQGIELSEYSYDWYCKE